MFSSSICFRDGFGTGGNDISRNLNITYQCFNPGISWQVISGSAVVRDFVRKHYVKVMTILI
jgi:hypothetical protein